MIDPIIIQPIFPTAIGMTQLERAYTDEEKQFFTKERSKQSRNIGNSMSTNNYVLEEPALAGLKEEINKALKSYTQQVYAPSNPDVELYITQSWLNYTRPGEFHHKHTHSNSLLSGVFYVNADEKLDKIVFINDAYKMIKIPSDNINHYNTETWDFTARTGLLLFFPSSIVHMVEKKLDSHNNTRVSLAFNTFIKGTLGANKSLTELKL